ncbi:MAG TPA: cupin domain-containing protein [Candidatus Acidoferrales bacterium]|nr:cupin domain-containing protein [Candidatus Acidoferrales bacterium]
MKSANIFAGISKAAGREELLTLFENSAVQIERIVSHSYSSPEDFWYDQPEPEWVMVMRGAATLEFEDGQLLEMKAGDHVTIPSHAKHRVQQTDPETIWLAVHVKGGR